MIRLDLGPEPAALSTERANRLPAAVAAFNAHGAGQALFTQLLDSGFQVVKQELRKRQHGKCAFCEKKEDSFKRPVEHFRPKKAAANLQNGSWVLVSTHYWWLTWTWENLYFSCDECNRQGRKGNRFPLEAGSQRINAPTAPAVHPVPQGYYDVSSERRLLVDPRNDDPLDHLSWIPVDGTKPRGSWNWTISGRDLRGDVTIDVLGLMARVDEVNLHLKPLRQFWRQIRGHADQGRLVDAQQCWDAVVTDFVEDADQPFRAAAWCALDSLFPHAERLALGLRDPPIPVVTYP